MTARLVRLLEREGHDPNAVCRAARVSVEEVTDPAARVGYAAVDRLLEATAAVLGAEDLGSAIAAIFDDRTYDAAGLVFATSRTFGEGLTRALEYQRLWGDGERLTLHIGADAMTLRFRHPGRSALAQAVFTELAFCETMGAARLLVDPTARAKSVRFSHARLGRSGLLAQTFGVPPRYGSKVSELVFDRALADAAVRLPEGMMNAKFESEARRAVQALPERASLVGRLKTLFGDGPEAFELSVVDAARKMHMSGRTLQRKLHDEGASFESVVDDVRRQRVEALLAGGMTAKEAAFHVGFADPSALARARTRWSRALAR